MGQRALFASPLPLDCLQVVPWGFRKLLVWVRDAYSNPPLVVTENGFSGTPGDLNDSDRISYYSVSTLLSRVPAFCE